MWVQRIFKLLLFSALAVQPLQAQTDSVFTLPIIAVTGLPLRAQPIGEFVERTDSQVLQRLGMYSLGELLSREGGLFIRQYGPGSLATPSIRGGSASHTAVIWNGFPIQSPMLGQLDLSLIPLFFMDDVRIHYGSSGANWGSGAVGGAIVLENKGQNQAPGWHFKSLARMGSFSTNQQFIQAAYVTNRFSLSTRYLRGSSVNDFPYRLTPQLPERKQQHAQWRQQGVLQEVQIKLTSTQNVGAVLWWQDNRRQIPPTTTQNQSKAIQADEVWRTMAFWKLTQSSYQLHVKSAWFKERIRYKDPLLGINAQSQFRTMITEAEALWSFHPQGRLHLGANYTSIEAEIPSYKDLASVQRLALFSMIGWEGTFVQTQVQLRQEVSDQQWAPIQPSISVVWKAASWLQFRARSARHFRWPTTNDLFWVPGGNPSLKPETGWSQEIGMDITEHPQITLKTTVYHRLLNDYILWSIAEGQSLWSVNNITQVRSRGIEQRASWTISTQPYLLRVQGGFDYTISTNEIKLTSPSIEAGEQMLYIPKYQLFASFNYMWKGWGIHYNHRLTGGSQGLNENIKGFDVGWLSLEKHLNVSTLKGNIQFHCDNIWNKSYRIVERRPMPGRSYNLSLFINLFIPK